MNDRFSNRAALSEAAFSSGVIRIETGTFFGIRLATRTYIDTIYTVRQAFRFKCFGGKKLKRLHAVICAYRRESGLFLPKRKWTTFLVQELLMTPARQVLHRQAEPTNRSIRALGCPWVDYRRSRRKKKWKKNILLGTEGRKCTKKTEAAVHFQIGRIRPFSDRSPHVALEAIQERRTLYEIASKHGQTMRSTSGYQ